MRRGTWRTLGGSRRVGRSVRWGCLYELGRVAYVLSRVLSSSISVDPRRVFASLLPLPRRKKVFLSWKSV
jgi:hypothetical protein